MDNLYDLTRALLVGGISNDLEWISKLFNDTKHRAGSLRQLSFLCETHQTSGFVLKHAAALCCVFKRLTLL